MQIMFLILFLLIHQSESHQKHETLLFCQNDEIPPNRDVPIISILVSHFRLKEFSSILFSKEFNFIFQEIENADLVVTTKTKCPHHFSKLDNISASRQYGSIFSSDFLYSFNNSNDDDSGLSAQFLQGFPRIIISFFIIIFTARFIYLTFFALKGFSMFQRNSSVESDNSNFDANKLTAKIRIMRTPEIKSNKDPDLTSDCPIKSHFVNIPNHGNDMVIYEKLIIPITRTRCISIEWLDSYPISTPNINSELKFDVQMNFDEDPRITKTTQQLTIIPHQIPDSFPSLEIRWKNSKIVAKPLSKPIAVTSNIPLPSRYQCNYNPFGYYPFHLSFYENLAAKFTYFLHLSENPFEQYAKFLVEFLDVYCFGFYLQIDQKLNCIQLTFNKRQEDSDTFNKEHITHQIEEYVRTTDVSVNHNENKCNYATFSGFRFESFKVDFGGQLFTTIILRKAQTFVLRVDERNQLQQAASILPSIYLSTVGDFNLLQIRRFDDICSRFDDLAFSLQVPSYSIGSIDGVCGSKLIGQFERIIKQKYKNEQIANIKNKTAVPDEIKNLTDTLLKNNNLMRRNSTMSKNNDHSHDDLNQLSPRPRHQTVPTSMTPTTVHRSVRFAYSPQVELQSSNTASQRRPTGSILKNPLQPDGANGKPSENQNSGRKLALDVVKIERVEAQLRSQFVSYLGAKRPEGMKMAFFNEKIGFFDHNFKIIPTNSMFSHLDIPGQKLSNLFDESALLANENGIFTIETKNKSEKQFFYTIFDDPKNPTSEALGCIVELKNPYQGVFLSTNSPIIVLIIDSLTGERVWSISQNSKYLSLASIAKQCHPGDRALLVESIEHARNVQPIQLSLNVRLLIDQDNRKNIDLIEMNSTDTSNFDLSLSPSNTSSTMFNSFSNTSDSDHDLSRQLGISNSFLPEVDEDSSANANIAYNSSDNVLEYMNMYKYYSVSIFRRDSRYFAISLSSIDNLKKRVETFRALDETISSAMRLAKITIWNFEDSNTPMRVYTTLPPFIMQLSMNWTTLHYNVLSTNTLSSSKSVIQGPLNRKSQDQLKPPLPKKDRERQLARSHANINNDPNNSQPKRPDLPGSNLPLISASSSPSLRRNPDSHLFASRHKEKRRSHFDEYSSPTDNERYENDVVKVFKRALATGESFSIEAPLIFNSIRWMTLRGISNGIPGQLLGTATDITQTKDAEDAVKKEKQRAIDANSSKMKFLANMSHEIRNPLHGMRTLLDLLLQTDLTAEQDELLECIIDSFLRLLELLNDTLDLAKIEQGKMQMSNVTFSPLDIFTTPLKKFTKLAGKKKLKIFCQTAPNLPLQVKGNPHFLGRIFSNLLSNAIKFTEKGFVLVQITFQHSQSSQPFVLNAKELSSHLVPSNNSFSLLPSDPRDLIIVNVYDSGIGIPVENQDLIFEEFRQGDPSVRRLYGGMGVGLALIKRMVTMLDGNITFNSKLGVGSTFTASIPVNFECCPFIPRTLIERHYKVLFLTDIQNIYDIPLHCSYYNIEICLNEAALSKGKSNYRQKKKRRGSSAPRKLTEQKKSHSHSESENMPPKLCFVPATSEKSTNLLIHHDPTEVSQYGPHQNADDDDIHTSNSSQFSSNPVNEDGSQFPSAFSIDIHPATDSIIGNEENQNENVSKWIPISTNPNTNHTPTVTFVRPIPQTKIKPYNSFTNMTLTGTPELVTFNPPTSSEFTTSTEDEEREKDDGVQDPHFKQIDDDLLCIFLNLTVVNNDETLRSQNKYMIQDALRIQAIHNDCAIAIFTNNTDEFKPDDIFSSKKAEFNIDRRRNKQRDFYVFKNPPPVNALPKFFRTLLWTKARARRKIREKERTQEDYDYSYYYEEEESPEEDQTEKEEKVKQTIPPEIMAKLIQLTEPPPPPPPAPTPPTPPASPASPASPTALPSIEPLEKMPSLNTKDISNRISIPNLSDSRQRRRGTSSVIPSSTKLSHTSETRSNSNINMDEIPSFSKPVPLARQPNSNRNSHSQITLAAELIFKENRHMFSGSDSTSSKKKKKKAPVDLSGIRILAADDDEINRQALTSIFRARNAAAYKVVENGAEVMNELQRVSNHDSQDSSSDSSQREEYDIVILDQNMPIMDGPSCAQAIRKSESSYSRIPIIAMTGSVMKEDEELCIESGMNMFLSKPVRLKDTVDAIRTLLSNRF